MRTHTPSPAQTLPHIFTHYLDPASLLKLTQDLYGRVSARAISTMICGKSFELQEQLSEPVTVAIPIAVQAIQRANFATELERRAATLVQHPQG